MKKFLLKFSDSLLSKEQIRNVKGGYDPGGGTGGGGSGYTYWCYIFGGPVWGPHYYPTCPSWSTALTLCQQQHGSNAMVSNVNC